MKKNTLIALIVLALVFVVGIGVGVRLLYKGEAPTVGTQNIEQFHLMDAIPSDAAAVLHFSDVKDGVRAMNDPTKAFGALVGSQPAMKSFFAQADSLLGGGRSAFRSQPMALSLHYSGSVVPLALICAPKSATDSTAQVREIIALADSCRLASSFYAGSGLRVVLISSSETLVNSSIRHMTDGHSILDNSDFVSCLQKTASKNLLLFSSTYSGKLLQTYFKKSVSRHASFIKTIGSWMGLSIMDSSDTDVKFNGCFSGTEGADAFWHAIEEQGSTQAQFAKVVPSGTYFAISVPMKDQAEYSASYGRYLDACSTLGANRQRISALKKNTGVDPVSWAKTLGVKEVAKAQWRVSETSYEALFVRVSKADNSLMQRISAADTLAGESAGSYLYSGFAAALYGDVFSMADESTCAIAGEWLVSGSAASIADFNTRNSEGDVLQSLMGDAALASASNLKDCSFAAYLSLGACPMEDVFAQPLLAEVQSLMNGASYAPCLLTASGSGYRLEVSRVPFINKTKTPAVVADAAIEVPAGPFEVQNSGTGKTNLLAQQSNYYLSLKEMDGKGIWSVPFSEPLCGMVQTIDYYVNGKLQFLFAAGSKIWLLDRLGRFVSGFPVELGKPVLLGPEVYDFTGAHGYSVMVLHTDNTVELYNIHGQKPADWKGITSEEKIISLPELFKCGGKSYWAVRTAAQTQIFGFNGGEPVYVQTGAKSIRRDSTIEVEDNGSIKAVCNDGKTRNIKL